LPKNIGINLKKSLLFLLLGASLFADAKIYMGANTGVYNESLDASNKNITTQIATLKIGYGDIASYGIEFSLDYVNNSSEIFHPDDGIKYGMNVNLLKSFDFDLFLNPYLKGGFGAGALKSTAKANKNSLAYGSFNLGFGAFIPLNDGFDLEVGYSYKYVSYEKVTPTSSIVKSHVNSMFTGINYRF